MLETHWEDAAGVARATVDAGYEEVRVTEDLTGRERVVEARWPE